MKKILQNTVVVYLFFMLVLFSCSKKEGVDGEKKEKRRKKPISEWMELFKNFNNDVPIYTLNLSKVEFSENEVKTLQLNTGDDFDATLNFYIAKLKDNGWTTVDYSQAKFKDEKNVIFECEKEKRCLTITIKSDIPADPKAPPPGTKITIVSKGN